MHLTQQTFLNKHLQKQPVSSWTHHRLLVRVWPRPAEPSVAAVWHPWWWANRLQEGCSLFLSLSYNPGHNCDRQTRSACIKSSEGREREREWRREGVPLSQEGGGSQHERRGGERRGGSCSESLWTSLIANVLAGTQGESLRGIIFPSPFFLRFLSEFKLLLSFYLFIFADFSSSLQSLQFLISPFSLH